jgi:hypothetical protein
MHYLIHFKLQIKYICWFFLPLRLYSSLLCTLLFLLSVSYRLLQAHIAWNLYVVSICSLKLPSRCCHHPVLPKQQLEINPNLTYPSTSYHHTLCPFQQGIQPQLVSSSNMSQSTHSSYTQLEINLSQSHLSTSSDQHFSTVAWNNLSQSHLSTSSDQHFSTVAWNSLPVFLKLTLTRPFCNLNLYSVATCPYNPTFLDIDINLNSYHVTT